MPFDKYELETIEHALKRTSDSMRASKYVGPDDPYFKKHEALRVKVVKLKKSAPGEG